MLAIHTEDSTKDTIMNPFLEPFTINEFSDGGKKLAAQGPAFVGIGTPKSGTSWWYELLLSHPDVVGNRLNQKELAYFYHFTFQKLTDDHIHTYRSAFDRSAFKVSGEWSPSYLYYPCALEALARAVPESRILILLRNPIDRFLSHINQFRRTHVERLETQGLKSLVEKYWGLPDAMGHSLYGEGVAKAIDYFGVEKVLCLQYERCRQDPLSEYRRTCRFLGIAVPVSFSELRTPVNPSTYTISDLKSGERRWLARYFRNDVLSLVRRTNDIDIRLWPDFME